MNTFTLIRRYSFSRFNRHRASSVKIALSFALSMAVLMIILAVMDMLQSSRFTLIRDIRSFDIIVEDASLEDVSALYPGYTVFHYKEGYALLNGEAFNIRYVDDGYKGGVNVLFGSGSSLLVPYGFYMRMPSETVDFSTLTRRGGRSIPVNLSIIPSGVYYTALSGEFDNMHAFMPYEGAPADAKEYVAVKGTDDTSPLENAGFTSFRTWKESESTLYSAFALENIMMFMVLAILLVIVYVEIRGEVRIFLKNKKKERLELLIIGCTREKTYFIFISSFLLILFSGLLLAIVLQEIGIILFSHILRLLAGYHATMHIDYGLFLVVSIVFFIITVFTIFLALYKDEKRSIMEVMHG